MASHRWITNWDALAVNERRITALSIVEAGLDAVDTERVVNQTISNDGATLHIGNTAVDLRPFKRIRVIGFGKASCMAARTLEHILGTKIHDGAVIDTSPQACAIITAYQGTHPKPSAINLKASEHIANIAEDSHEGDLVLVIVSGGGSSLLCWPPEECEQDQRLYDTLTAAGATIEELNTVRKHLPSLKGGGLAELLYPARVVGLIFSDIPGNDHADVASGPTFKDTTTMRDAEQILARYDASNQFHLRETPKDKKYFNTVTNIVVVSNKQALSAMAGAAAKFLLSPTIVSDQLYDNADDAVRRFTDNMTPHGARLAGGEIRLIVKNHDGSGGRCQYLAMKMLDALGPDDVFVAIGSDGIDNSDAAGAIVDAKTRDIVAAKHLDIKKYNERFDSYTFFKKTDNLIFTGPTQANVSDLMMLIRF